jgi:CRP-like cAMP-binding protein
VERIRTFFQKYADLSDEDWAAVSSRFSRHEVPKKGCTLEVGQVENFISFIETGIVRYFIPKEDRNEITFELTFADDFMGAYDSFLTRQPSSYCVQALSDTVLWRLSYDDVQSLYRETRLGNLVGRLASERMYLEKARRELSFLNENAEQRYLRLLTEQPNLIQHIPLQYIASYIGVTPQALSRIRRRIS